MPTLTIRKWLHSPTFGTWKWAEGDYAVPLAFQLEGARTQVYVEKETNLRTNPLQITMRLEFLVIFENPPKENLDALKSSGAKSTRFAQQIYDYFSQTMSRFEALLIVFGGVRNLLSMGLPSIQSFFDARGWREEVTWQIDGSKPQIFRPKLNQPRGKNPLFRHPQLVTGKKWKRLQQIIDAGNFPSDEVVELNRLIGKVYFRSRRLPLVEAAILIESKLKSYAEAILPERGFTKGKIKDLRDELGFNTVLNLVLPLTLSKAEAKRVSQWRPKVDRIRKIRNDIVHNNLSDAAIDEKEVLDGIRAAVDLFDFIEAKLPRA